MLNNDFNWSKFKNLANNNNSYLNDTMLKLDVST